MENAAAADEWKDDQREIRRWHKSNFLGLQQMRKQYDVFPYSLLQYLIYQKVLFNLVFTNF